MWEPKRSSPTTSLGSKELHHHHSVMIEPGKIPRAKIMDQHIIDRYLMRGLLNLAQHRAGEYLLAQATKARIWPTGVDLTNTGHTGGLHNYVPFGMFPFGRTLLLIRDSCGSLHVKIIHAVISCNQDVSADDGKMTVLRESLDVVDRCKLRGRGDLLFRMRKASV